MDDQYESTDEYNLRQYLLMLRTLQLYKDGSISFGHLISNLSALLGALKEPKEYWVEKFQSLWGKLEDTYAVMLDEGRTQFNDFDRQLVERALSDLEPLIKTEADRTATLSSSFRVTSHDS